MYSLAVFVVCAFGCVLAIPSPERCDVTAWGPWGQCVRNPPCPHPEQVQSISYTKAPAVMDEGRIKMQKMMAEKNKQRLELGKCRADGTCPELAKKSSMGPIKCFNGMAGEYRCRNADLVYYLSIEDLGYKPSIIEDPNPEANDVWGWTDPDNGEEYVIQGLSGGSSFVRIHNDINKAPEVLAFLPSRDGSPVIWRDMKVIGNYAFIVSECTDHGMQVVDMTQFRGQTEFKVIEATAEYGTFGNAHNIAANVETNFLYVIGDTDRFYPDSCTGGLHVIDVSDPLNPKLAGCFDQDGYVHDTQCVIYKGPDMNYQGREVCFCFNEDSFTIVDVHNKTDMRLISKRGYAGYGYTHQGWVTEDHRVVLMDDELDEMENPDPDNSGTRTYMWDITNLEQPVLRYTHYSSEPSSDHNQYVLGNYVFQANYRAGLRILRIDQENFSLEEHAYFDNFPPSDIVGFGGAWSSYPYFASGIVPASSIEYGLFLIRPNWTLIEESVAESKAYSEQKRTRQVELYTKGAECPELEQSRPCAAAPSC